MPTCRIRTLPGHYFERAHLDPRPGDRENYPRYKSADLGIDFIEGEPASEYVGPRLECSPPLGEQRGLTKASRGNDEGDRATQTCVAAFEQDVMGSDRNPLLRRRQFADEQPAPAQPPLEQLLRDLQRLRSSSRIAWSHNTPPFCRHQGVKMSRHAAVLNFIQTLAF